MSKCRYCDKQATRRVQMNRGPFCEAHWQLFLLVLEIFDRDVVKGGTTVNV